MLTIDLHLHTKFSDGSMSLPQMVNLCGEAGLDAIAITDHLCATDGILGKAARYLKWTLTAETWNEYIKLIESEKNRAWREYKMILFAGVEFTRNSFSHGRSAHLLALNIKEYILPNQSEEKWLLEARRQGAVTVAAHPMKVLDAKSQTYYLLNRQKDFAPLIDIWEVANARTFWPEMLNTPYSLMASSDTHHKNLWHGWRTRIKCDKDPDAILAATKNSSIERTFAFIKGKCSEITEEIFPHEYLVKKKNRDGVFPLANLMPSF